MFLNNRLQIQNGDLKNEDEDNISYFHPDLMNESEIKIKVK